MTLTTPMRTLPMIEPIVPSDATRRYTAPTAAAIDNKTTRMGDMAARTLAIQPPMPVMSEAMAMLADATSEDKTETT